MLPPTRSKPLLMFGKTKLRHRHKREFEFLVSMLCDALRSPAMGLQTNRLATAIDWDAFVYLVERHRVVPLVLSVLVNESDVPATVLNRLRVDRDFITCNNLRLASELVRIARLFGHNSIPLMAIKGPTLATQLYGGLEQRQFVDLDVLVPPDHLSSALGLLADSGYRSRSMEMQQLSTSQLARVMADSKSTDMYRHDHLGEIQLDLHWRLSNDNAFFPTATEPLFETSDRMEISGQEVLIMRRDDRLKYLAFHGGNHRWMRLSWLCDLGKAIQEYPRSQWPLLLSGEEGVRRDPLSRYLASGLLLLEKLGLVDDLANTIDTQTRRRLKWVVGRMHQVLSADEAVPLLNVLADGWWRYQYTGRLAPLTNSVRRFLKPKARDFQSDGVVRPYFSRWLYIAAAALRRSKNKG